MGLDITAYQNLVKTPFIMKADGYIIELGTGAIQGDDFFIAGINTDFPGREGNIEDGGIYSYEKREGFRAGSYSGYNQWREDLACFVGYLVLPYERYGQTVMRHDAGAWAAKEGPFKELINFSDCEGVIAGAVARKLANDFREYEELAKTFGDERWRSLYQEWKNAFEMAEQNGAVDFH